MRRIWPCLRKAKAFLEFMITTALAAIALTSTAGAAPGTVGAVYVQSNSIPNTVRVFYRSATGELNPGPNVPTGGNGSMVNPPLGFPVTDSQNSVVLTQDNRVLLVTNSGSNTISSFRVLPDGNIVLADHESSGGMRPISIAVTNGGTGRSLVYALNEDSETVSGFTLDRQGNLTPIPGSTRTVTGMFSATVGFNKDGHVLTVTNRNNLFVPTPNGSISTFPVDSSTGLLGPEVVTPAIGTGAPFGFEYTKRDQLLVADSGQAALGFAGSASSYDLVQRAATLTPRDTKPTGGATCWVAVTNNNQFAYFTNALTLDVVGFSITSDSRLIPIGRWTTLGSALDVDTSVNSQYLYVLNTNINFSTFAFTDSRVTAYKIDNSNGQLTLIGSTPAGSGGNSGLAAY